MLRVQLTLLPKASHISLCANVLQVLLEGRVLEDLRALQESRVFRVQWAGPVHSDLRVQRAPQVEAALDGQEHRVYRDRREIPDSWVFREGLVDRDSLDFQDLLVDRVCVIPVDFSFIYYSLL